MTGGIAKNEWAKALGLASASVELSSKSENDDSVTVKVASPNVCLSYVSAEYKEQKPLFGWSAPETRSIRSANGQTTFRLEPGTYSTSSTADVKGWSEANKPRFRLKFIGSEQEASLFICAHGGPSDAPEKCTPLTKDDNGSWSISKRVGKYWVSNNDLSIVHLNLQANRNGDGSLTVDNPRLDVSQYKLSFR